jgi:hypothetical protein
MHAQSHHLSDLFAPSVEWAMPWIDDGNIQQHFNKERNGDLPPFALSLDTAVKDSCLSSGLSDETTAFQQLGSQQQQTLHQCFKFALAFQNVWTFERRAFRPASKLLSNRHVQTVRGALL